MALSRYLGVVSKLFLTYVTAGSLLGAILTATYVLSDEPLGSLLSSSDTFWDVAGIVGTIWLLALIPAAPAALLLCIAMAVWPRLYSHRRLRTAVAALLAAISTSLAILFASGGERPISALATDLWFLVAIAVLSATALGLLFPRPQQVPSNPSLELP